MPNQLFQSDIISINDFMHDEVQLILNTAENFKKNPPANLLKNKIVAHCFFEPSTRTRLSFETATLRLGGSVIGFIDGQYTSLKKGESLHDTIKIMSSYADAIIIRHSQEGSARLAAEVSDKPVINAGDAANQHPTQALLDLFSIKESQHSLSGLNVAIVGDLKYGRTVHSLVIALAQFDNRLFLVSPESLSLPDTVFDLLKMKGVKFSCHRKIEEIINKVDILYMTRMQKERFDEEDLQKKNNYALTLEMLQSVKPNLKILHPLPRNYEIAVAIDQSPYAYYFDQAANGIWVRQAVLSLLLNEELS
jgi:aspartate carbamoyltransferase catalytic subunit